MTLIVYKNGILAGDHRATVLGNIIDKHDHCAHCGEEAMIVSDNHTKLTISKADKEIKFRGSKVLAVGQAGNQALSKRMVSALMNGKDIEEIYANYLVIVGNLTENKHISTFLLCCEDCIFTVRIPHKGELDVTKFGKDKVVAIGSDLKVVEWIDTLMPNTNAVDIINLVMAKNKGIGGPISMVDLAADKMEIKKVDKKDPAEMLKEAINVFAAGKDMLQPKSDTSMNQKKRNSKR